MKKLSGWLGLVLLMSISASGCAQTTPTAEPGQPAEVSPTAPAKSPVSPAPTATVEPVRTSQAGIEVSDALDRKVSFEGLPQNLVIAGKATQLIVNTLYLFPEAKERVAHVEYRSQTKNLFLPLIDPLARQKADLERDAGPEQIAPLKPDVVLLKSYMQSNLGDPIEQLGIKIIYLDLETPEAFYRELETLARLFGDEPRGEQIVEFYRSRAQALQTPLEKISEDERPAVLILQYSKTGEEVAFSVPPAGYLQTGMVSTAGGSPVWSDVNASGGWTVVSFEQIAAWNPEMIFLVDYKGSAPEVVAGLAQNEQWASLPAMKAGKVFPFPCDFLSWDQPDPRWILGQEWLAKMIHADRFADLDMREQVVTFYEEMYGLSSATIEQQVLPLLADYPLFDQPAE